MAQWVSEHDRCLSRRPLDLSLRVSLRGFFCCPPQHRWHLCSQQCAVSLPWTPYPVLGAESCQKFVVLNVSNTLSASPGRQLSNKTLAPSHKFTQVHVPMGWLNRIGKRKKSYDIWNNYIQWYFSHFGFSCTSPHLLVYLALVKKSTDKKMRSNTSLQQKGHLFS